jgi:hypothetical protein
MWKVLAIDSFTHHKADPYQPSPKSFQEFVCVSHNAQTGKHAWHYRAYCPGSASEQAPYRLHILQAVSRQNCTGKASLAPRNRPNALVVR